MSHIRTQVRAAVLAAVTGLATTGAHAYVAHEYPLLSTELPCVLVATSDTAAADSASAPTLLRRLVLIEVQAVAKATSGLVDTLDQIGKEVEEALAGPLTIDGRSLYPRYTGSAPADLSVETDRPVGALAITFELEFYTAANDADSLF